MTIKKALNGFLFQLLCETLNVLPPKTSMDFLTPSTAQ
jgi:hypothetical protein